MNYKIIADSCCDITKELQEKFKAIIIPLTLTLGKKNYTDDDTLDMPKFMEEMFNCKEKVGTAAPSPELFKDAFSGEHTSFGITISANLSGTYESAMLGKRLAEEDGKADVHVFDTKSACAGEALIAIKIHEMIEKGLQKSQIIASIDNFIKEMKTYFVLDSIDNLLKNGRLNKIVGNLISVLRIKPLMGADGDGNIALYSYARGQKQIIDKLTDIIGKSGKKTEGQSMVIAHCNNQTLAQTLFTSIKNRYNFKNIFVVPTRGVSTIYANDKGIVIAF
ncbi:hypothetical protein FACS189490_07340 [Clostridia bacterium]|nr:hypothetical protein FACS189490_07340 [Clostridia bacterium]